MFRVPQLLAASEQHEFFAGAIGVALILFFVAFFAAKSCWGNCLLDTFWICGGLLTVIATILIAFLMNATPGFLVRYQKLQYSHSMLICLIPQAGMLFGYIWARTQKWLKKMEGDESVPRE
jgi:hypothetical protein